MLTPVQPHEWSTYVPTQLCAADLLVWGGMLPHAANLSNNFGGYAFSMSAAACRFGTLPLSQAGLQYRLSDFAGQPQFS
jgi:hypothetical protein